MNSFKGVTVIYQFSGDDYNPPLLHGFDRAFRENKSLFWRNVCNSFLRVTFIALYSIDK
jgi:hypothetical protein